MTSHPAKPSLARREREQLCSLFDGVGPTAPTLCEGWLAEDLLAHLVLREGHPAALGIALKPLARWQAHVQKHLAQQPFPDLVNRLRTGPPRHSPLRPEKVDAAFNTFELFVHHEDVRRAQLEWQPRALPDSDQKLLWHLLAARGKHFVRKCTVGVVLKDHTGMESTIRDREAVVTLTGQPAELVLYLHGRQEHSDVTVSGDVEAVEQFLNAKLSL